jgi:hypothetical protein
MKMKHLLVLISALCSSRVAFAQSSTIVPPLRIYQAGTRLPLRYRLNMIGATCVDDPSHTQTTCTFTGGGGSITIASGQVAYATGTNAVGGDTGMTYASSVLSLGVTSTAGRVQGGGTTGGLILLDSVSNNANITLAPSTGNVSLNASGKVSVSSSAADGSSALALDVNASAGWADPAARLGRLRSAGTEKIGFFADGMIGIASTARSTPTAAGQLVWDGTNFKMALTSGAWTNIPTSGGGSSTTLIYDVAATAGALGSSLSAGGSTTVGNEIIDGVASTGTGCKFYWPGGAGAKTVRCRLYAYGGSSLASVDVAVNSAGEYSGTFGSSVSLTANTLYAISMWETSGTDFVTSTTGGPALPTMMGVNMMLFSGKFSSGDTSPTTSNPTPYPVVLTYTIP